jgi:hypothetical protein
MKSTDINRFPIREYLAGLNIYPAKERGYYGMYHSPFREDNNASMKVDYDKNLWIDYGSNEGGTLIDLVMRIENCSAGEAMQKLEHLSGTPSFLRRKVWTKPDNKRTKAYKSMICGFFCAFFVRDKGYEKDSKRHCFVPKSLPIPFRTKTVTICPNLTARCPNLYSMYISHN